jgi:hypothetical protein
VIAAEDPLRRLSRRLRALRTEQWPRKRITQAELGAALDASPPLISSWESKRKPKAPPPDRLEAYATFFATERSVAQTPFRLLPESSLTGEERTRREELLEELTSLRNGIEGDEPEPDSDPFARNHWRFTSTHHITIVVSELPSQYFEGSKLYSHPDGPDYVRLYRFADLDALLELHGHIRAANPRSEVRVRVSSELQADDFTSHLVLLGGVDWNPTTRDMLHRVGLPVRQLLRPTEEDPGGFEVIDSGKARLIAPELQESDDQETLVADAALFYRAPNPLNHKRTVTICAGCYQRGSLGAVRALTDPRFRNRNEEYVRARFGDGREFGIISKATVILGEVVTPDWTKPDELLYEWPV